MIDAIEFARVTLGFGGRPVLRDVSFAIAPGEFVGLLGPNGAGKTTLLRAVLGLVPPEAGHIRMFGRAAARGGRGIGYMPQARSLVAAPRMPGRDFVAAAGGAHWGLPWPDAATWRDVDWALEMVDAAALARRPLGELSGGERQRLLLAQALLGRPKLLLLDEPLMSLDPRHQQGVVALARRLQAELGATVLFSAHELNPLLGAMDRVLYLGQGRAAIGPVDAVVTGPVLSLLYGAEIEVVRAGTRIFVLMGDQAAERECGHGGGHGAHRQEDMRRRVRV